MRNHRGVIVKVRGMSVLLAAGVEGGGIDHCGCTDPTEVRSQVGGLIEAAVDQEQSSQAASAS